jgi:flagellar M-ring protein FliF
VNQIAQLLARLSGPQKIGLAAAAVAVLGGLLTLQHWNRERGFRPLFAGLSPEDAGPIAARLRDSQLDYRLADGGSTILVQEDKVAEVRLQLAAAGLPQSGRIGFELFDQTNFGASEFAEQVNYHRALEGELERSVVSIREVERARVHVALPKDSLYKESRQPAKASVLVKLRPGAELTAANVAAIAHLAASAVPGLQASQVTVLDTAGNLLSRPRTAGLDDGGPASEAALEYRKSIEREVQLKLAETLEPLLGAGRFRIGVSAELDLTSGDQSEEIFDPEKSVMVSSQTSQDLPAAAAAEGGVPGTASNLPRAEASRATAAASVTAYGRRTENINYQTSRVVRHTRLPQGAVKRLSLSVLVDHALRYQDGKPVVEPPTPEKLKVIRDLAAAAVGLNAGRGDQLVVEAFPFESTLSAQPLDFDQPREPASPTGMPLPRWLTGLAGGGRMLLLAAIGAGVGVLLLAIVAFLWMRRRRKRRTPAMAPAPAQLESPTLEAQKQIEARLAEQAAEQARKEAEAILALKIPAVSTKKTEVLTKHIASEVKKDPQAMAHVVRSWLNGEYKR